jgi:hypothetical protein
MAEAQVQRILAERDPLPVEMLVPAHHRTVSAHDEFRRSLAPPRPFDPIDPAVEEMEGTT